MITGNFTVTKLTPDTGMHLKNINSGDIYEGVIFLGVSDSPINYIEVTEQEYQTYLLAKQQDEGNN